MQCCDRKKAVTRLKRAHGHLAKVINMLEKDSYCIDIIQQSLAVIGHLKSANQVIFNNHLHTCLIEGIQKGDIKEQEKLFKEIMHVLCVTGR